MQSTLALLGKLKTQMPEIWGQAQVVGQWVWLEFNVPPLREIRAKLKELGFHWNQQRRCWQHPCGAPTGRSGADPRGSMKCVPHFLLLNDALRSQAAYRQGDSK
jgi:hypothetical protein